MVQIWHPTTHDSRSRWSKKPGHEVPRGGKAEDHARPIAIESRENHQDERRHDGQAQADEAQLRRRKDGELRHHAPHGVWKKGKDHPLQKESEAQEG